MPQPNDLSRSLVALDQDSTIIAVVEMSQSSWSRDDRIARQLPGGCHDPEACRTANAASQLRPSKKRLGFNTETSMSSRQRALTLI